MSRTLSTMWFTPRGVTALLGACLCSVVAMIYPPSRARGAPRVPRGAERGGLGGRPEPPMFLFENYHAALHGPAAHRLEAFVDLVELPGAAYQLVDLQPPFLVLI